MSELVKGDFFKYRGQSLLLSEGKLLLSVLGRLVWQEPQSEMGVSSPIRICVLEDLYA